MQQALNVNYRWDANSLALQSEIYPEIVDCIPTGIILYKMIQQLFLH
jgi:hypothetical protein